MGFGSSLKRAFKAVSTGGLSEVGRLTGSNTGFTTLGLAAGGIGGALTGAALDELNKKRETQGLSALTQEQVTTANLFSKLSPEQQKDLLINNPNIVTALGEQRFDPLTNTITLTESPFVKSQRERQEALAAQLTGSLTGELPSTDPSARFEEGRALFAPAFQEQREQLEQQLADQGLPRGSEAFNRELNRLEQSQGRQLRELARESVATSEAQRQARFNEISALLGQQQVGGIGFGQFSPQFSGLDLFGAEQAGLNRAFQAEQARKERSAAQRAALIGGLGQLGGAAIGAFASDLRLKENIEKVGYSESGIPIYEFDYINKSYGEGRYRGTIAQDLLNINPDAVIEDNGVYKVDYSVIDVDFVRV